MARVTAVLVLLTLCVVGKALTPATYFTQADRERLRSVFNVVYGDADVELIHYSILGFSLLDETIPNPKQACEAIKNKVDSSNVDSLFYATSAANNLKASKTTCEVAGGNTESLLNEAISEDSSSEKIYHAVAALSNLKLKVDAKKTTAAIDAALKADESPISHAYAFYATSYLSGDLKKYHDLIEDIIAQADVVDDKYLQFENGLLTTATVIDASYKLAATAKLAPTFTEEQVIQLANYFLSRKHVQSVKNAAAVLAVIKTFTTNQFHIPVAVTLSSQVSVSQKSPKVQVRVSNLLGQIQGQLTVTAETARHLGDDAVVLSKTPLTQSASDKSLFELDFMKVNPARGFYSIALSIVPKPADARLMGTSGAEVEVKVTTQVTVENVEISVADREQGGSLRTTKLQPLQKAATALEADYHQRVVMTFQLRDKAADELMLAHQAFVRLTQKSSGREIVFIAEPDSSDTYKFDLDVGAKAKDFGHLSGAYTMTLLVGDAVIENPLSWTLSDVSLTFADSPASSDKPDLYAASPEIKHKFREPEQRPPQMVSNLFTGLLLLPALILLLLWLRIGVNISNFPMSLSAVGFHVGLGAIFMLYYLYWTHLNMFVTLRYLAFIGIPTFLFGNRLLSGIAGKRK